MHSRPETGSLHPMAVEVGCFSVTKSTVFFEFLCEKPGDTSPLKGVLSDACSQQLFQLRKPEKLARTSYS